MTMIAPPHSPDRHAETDSSSCLCDRLPANFSMTESILGLRTSGRYRENYWSHERFSDALPDTPKSQQDSCVQLKAIRFLVQSKRGN